MKRTALIRTGASEIGTVARNSLDDATISSLHDLSAADAFAVPQNATVWGNCDIEPWKLKEKQHPVYPMAARQEHRQGTVILYGVIEEDGSVSHLQVVASAGQDLDASSMAAASHWKYDRSGCQEVKARQENIHRRDFFFPLLKFYAWGWDLS